MKFIKALLFLSLFFNVACQKDEKGVVDTQQDADAAISDLNSKLTSFNEQGIDVYMDTFDSSEQKINSSTDTQWLKDLKQELDSFDSTANEVLSYVRNDETVYHLEESKIESMAENSSHLSNVIEARLVELKEQKVQLAKDEQDKKERLETERLEAEAKKELERKYYEDNESTHNLLKNLESKGFTFKYSQDFNSTTINASPYDMIGSLGIDKTVEELQNFLEAIDSGDRSIDPIHETEEAKVKLIRDIAKKLTEPEVRDELAMRSSIQKAVKLSDTVLKEVAIENNKEASILAFKSYKVESEKAVTLIEKYLTDYNVSDQKLEETKKLLSQREELIQNSLKEAGYSADVIAPTAGTNSDSN